jgi:hypothetical protein
MPRRDPRPERFGYDSGGFSPLQSAHFIIFMPIPAPFPIGAASDIDRT